VPKLEFGILCNIFYVFLTPQNQLETEKKIVLLVKVFLFDQEEKIFSQ
jgi:hypothetical protein